MFILTAVVSVFLAAVMALSAVRKARPGGDSAALRDRLGVAPALWSSTGVPEALAAAGLVTGLWWAPLGFAAAAGVVLLMLGAVAFHLRARFLGVALAPPVGVAVLAVAAAALRLTTA